MEAQPRDVQRYICAVAIKALKLKIFAKLKNIGQTMKDVKMPTSDSYHYYLIESLKKKPELAAAYITATLEEKDPEPELLKMALSNVAEALGEQNMKPEQEKLHLEKLDELLSQRASEAIYNLGTWLNALGLKLTVTVGEKVEDTMINTNNSSEVKV